MLPSSMRMLTKSYFFFVCLFERHALGMGKFDKLPNFCSVTDGKDPDALHEFAQYPWCFVTKPLSTWEYCLLPVCGEFKFREVDIIID